MGVGIFCSEFLPALQCPMVKCIRLLGLSSLDELGGLRIDNSRQVFPILRHSWVTRRQLLTKGKCFFCPLHLFAWFPGTPGSVCHLVILLAKSCLIFRLIGVSADE